MKQHHESAKAGTKRLSATEGNALSLLRPAYESDFVVLAVRHVLLTWSKMPWQWLRDATAERDTPGIRNMWEQAPGLPRLLARLSLAYALKGPKGTPGIGGDGQTVEFWEAGLQVLRVARHEEHLGYGRPMLDEHLDKALQHFYHPISFSRFKERAGGISGHVVRSEDAKVIEELRQALLRSASA